MGGFDVCSFTDAEWSKLEEAYVGFIAEAVGKSADDVKDVTGTPGHVSIHGAEATAQMPMPFHLVSFTLDGEEVDVPAFDEAVNKDGGKKLRDTMHDILVPSPPGLHKHALAQRVVAKADKDGDGELDVSELIAVMRLTYQLPKDTSKADPDHGTRSVDAVLQERLKSNDGKAEAIIEDQGIRLQQMACKLGVAEEPADEGIECGLLDRIFIPKKQGADTGIPLNGPLTGLHFQGDVKDLESNREECKQFDASDEIDGHGAESKFEVVGLVPALKASGIGSSALVAVALVSSLLSLAGLAIRLRRCRTPLGDAAGDQTTEELLATSSACAEDAL